MSTLTKILIILLTISSIFLCGIVVTYVANADNYRQLYNDRRDEIRSLEGERDDLTKQLNDQIGQKEALDKKLTAEIARLTGELQQVQTQLTNAEREKADLQIRINNWTSVVENFSKSTDNQNQLFANAVAELKRLESEKTILNKQLDETTYSLEQKMAIIDTLNTEKKRLLEEKTELQSRLDQLLQPIGKRPTEPVPVTPKKTIVRPITPVSKDIGLKALVSKVDSKHSMAKISIGKADGVKEGMRFHVTRGDEFICDILIIDVDAEEAVGVLELIQQQPKAGDNAATNL